MSRARRHRGASLAFGVLVGGAFYWLLVDALLATAVGFAAAASALLLLRISREFPDRTTGDGWEDGRWTAFSLAVANFGALVGIQTIPLENGYRAAIGFLLVFVGLSAYCGGSLAEMERDRLRSGREAEESVADGR